MQGESDQYRHSKNGFLNLERLAFLGGRTEEDCSELELIVWSGRIIGIIFIFVCVFLFCFLFDCSCLQSVCTSWPMKW